MARFTLPRDLYYGKGAMEELRHWADRLETMVADDLWPLPSYQEMLFMK